MCGNRNPITVASLQRGRCVIEMCRPRKILQLKTIYLMVLQDAERQPLLESLQAWQLVPYTDGAREEELKMLHQK